VLKAKVRDKKLTEQLLRDHEAPASDFSNFNDSKSSFVVFVHHSKEVFPFDFNQTRFYCAEKG